MYHGVDKLGRPLYFEIVKNFNPAKFLEITTVERILQARVSSGILSPWHKYS